MAETAPTAAAIGRLNHAGFSERMPCTAFVVTGGHLVTAAHCIPNRASNPIIFLPGYDRGSYAEVVQLRPDTNQTVPGRDISIRCDAVAKDAPALSLSAQNSGAAGAATLAGYGMPRQHVLQMVMCSAQAGPRAVTVDCPLTRGTSGGPVLKGKDVRPLVMAVVSRTRRDSTVADRLAPRDLAICD